MQKDVHVLPKDDQWKVQTNGSEKAYRITSTQKEAIAIAKEVAKNNKSELLIHGKMAKLEKKTLMVMTQEKLKDSL
ncbi:DUF2188 domain-containing protein [Myroides odoratimimus]|uniref:DUF2188 domain-containing protein n=1 Tax=Myroides odoratimimus TaxID=76832 RepID=UPI002574DAC8|nr:DUF2188 domain-containing protein [Myroides odoratimimus]